MTTFPALRDELNHWFFEEYFKDFIAIGVGKIDAGSILSYWGAPLHVSNASLSKWITSAEEVVKFLQDMQSALVEAGYTHTEVLDQRLTIYNENASRVETIMSRRRSDGTEIDRAAISFEIRRTDESWIIVSTPLRPTEMSRLQDVW